MRVVPLVVVNVHSTLRFLSILIPLAIPPSVRLRGWMFPTKSGLSGDTERLALESITIGNEGLPYDVLSSKGVGTPPQRRV